MANEPKPAEFDAWRPWEHRLDPDRQRTFRVTKEAHELPIVIELSRDAAFRTRAHDWAWSTSCPTPVTQTATSWPPKYATAIEWIGQYYHAIYSRHIAHRPDLVTTVTTMEEAKNQAKALSSANPFLRF